MKSRCRKPIDNKHGGLNGFNPKSCRHVSLNEKRTSDFIEVTILMFSNTVLSVGFRTRFSKMSTMF